MLDTCRACGGPAASFQEIVSRHPTSEGVVVYTRCACGVLHVRLLRHDDEFGAIVAHGRPYRG